jgi:CBS-domain-containing membrane protein
MTVDSMSARSRPTPEPWQRPVREFTGLVHLAPAISHPDDPLTAVVEAFARDSGAGMVFVVDTEDRLLGCIPEGTLDADLVTVVLPERLWSSLLDMDTRAVLRVARATPRHARDLMQPVRSVTPDAPLKDALAAMARAEQPVTPLLDAEGRLLGYLRLFEVLAHFIRASR